MGHTVKAGCLDCGKRFTIDQGGGFIFHLVRCDGCGKQKRILFADLDVLLVVSPAGVERLDPTALDATPLLRPMDPLTPVWSLPVLPAGEPVAGPGVAAWWRRAQRG